MILGTLTTTFYTVVQFSITLLNLLILIIYPPVNSRLGYTMISSLETFFFILALVEGGFILLTHVYRENDLGGHRFLAVSDIVQSMCSAHGQLAFICYMIKSEIFSNYQTYSHLNQYVYANAWYTQIFASFVILQLILCLFGSSKREYIRSHAVSSATLTSLIITHNLYYLVTYQ